MNKFILLFFALFAASNSFSYSESDTWKNYQALLNSVTTSLEFNGKYGDFNQTAVDYDRLKNTPSLQSLMSLQIKTLSETDLPLPQKELKIFWINAYNFFTLVEMSQHWPTESMKDIGWKNIVHSVGGKIYSLDQIEHEILRPMGDPRIHFTINCASVGCPSLDKKIYNTREAEKQINEAVKNALKNPLHLVVLKNDHVLGTKIFDWFQDDFLDVGGVASFVSKYGPVQTSEVGDFSYDWRVNTKENFDEKYRELISDYPHLKVKSK